MLRGARCPIEDEETAVRETFQGLDLNHDGKVSFAEFVHAALMGNFVGGTPASPPKLPPIPPDSSAPPTMAEMDSEEAEIRGIYERYNPAKLADLPRLLAKYRAGEGLSVMLERLKIKYHVAPSEEEGKLPTFGKKPSMEPPGGSTPWYQRAASTGSSEGRVPEQAVGGEAGGAGRGEGGSPHHPWHQPRLPAMQDLSSPPSRQPPPVGEEAAEFGVSEPPAPGGFIRASPVSAGKKKKVTLLI